MELVAPEITAVARPEPRQRAWSWLPSLAQWTFVAVLGWLFASEQGPKTLLADGDLGWHIRAGEWILANGRVPLEDLFSFSMAGREWFAWEWLADVLFALAHRWNGLVGVTIASAALIAGAAALMLRLLLRQGADLFVALLLTFAAASVSTIHWLARPHLFTWLLFLAALALLESDRRRPSRRVWLLVPLTALWVNLHGGFVAGLATVTAYGVGGIVERWRQGSPRLHSHAVRAGALLAACLLATLVNPYGWDLHRHISGYLNSDFILEHVEEFQSPNFRGESMALLEVWLFAAVLAAGRLLQKGEFARPLVALLWAHAALTSVRHAPLFVLAAAPLIAAALAEALEWGARRSAHVRALQEVGADYRPDDSQHGAPWLALVAMAAVAIVAPGRLASENAPADFPSEKFPVAACDSIGEGIADRRLLTTDQWGDYLIYRYSPRARVFIDGRSDFYAPEIRDDYLALMTARRNWRELLDRYGFEAALVPADWPLASLLAADPSWKQVYDDDQALYFERLPEVEP